jgi:RsiW-degrading membrane proteinase PrsW (M82 family)
MIRPFRAWAALIADPEHDRLFIGSPLRRPWIGKLITAALFVLLIFTVFIQLALFLVLHLNGAWIFLKALMLSSLLAIVPLAILWYLDRRERESPWLFAAAFIWGGCIATAIAMPFNTVFFIIIDVWVANHPMITDVLGKDASELLAAPIAAPITEECAKALGVLVLLWLLRAEFDSMRDGLVYGALVGLGFNWLESALYVAQEYLKSGTPPYGAQLGVRYALFGLGGHALFSGIFGASVGLAIQMPKRWWRFLVPIAGLLVAVAGHTLWNGLPLLFALASRADSAADTAKPEALQTEAPDMGFIEAFATFSLLELAVFFPLIVLAAVALWRSGVWERRVIREELASEVGRTISEAEYRQIVGDRIFHTRRIDRMHRRLAAALVNAQNELAFRKRRVRDEGGDPEQDLIVARWRDRIRSMRAAS